MWLTPVLFLTPPIVFQVLPAMIPEFDTGIIPKHSQMGPKATTIANHNNSKGQIQNRIKTLNAHSDSTEVGCFLARSLWGFNPGHYVYPLGP